MESHFKSPNEKSIMDCQKLEVTKIQDSLTDSNAYLWSINNKGLIIDPNCSEKIEGILEEKKVQPEWILLTHEHCDHIGGVEKLREKYHIPVICSDACSVNMQNTRRNMSSIMELFLHYKGKKVTYEPFTCKPGEVTFTSSYEFDWQGIHVRCENVPGHTEGSSLIFLKWEQEELVMTGDYLIQGEKVMTRLQAGAPDRYLEEGKKSLLALPTGIHVYPGHGLDYRLDDKGEWKHGL